MNHVSGWALLAHPRNLWSPYYGFCRRCSAASTQSSHVVSVFSFSRSLWLFWVKVCAKIAMHAHKSILQTNALFRCCSPLRTDLRRRHRVACTTRMKQAENIGESHSQHASRNQPAPLALSTPNGSYSVAADQQLQQHLKAGRRFTERLRLAAWVLGLGLVLVWRLNIVRSAGAAGFASFTLSNSFETASQTGALLSYIRLITTECHG